MRQNPHVRICGGPGSATTLVYPTLESRGDAQGNVRSSSLVTAWQPARPFSDPVSRLCRWASAGSMPSAQWIQRGGRAVAGMLTIATAGGS